MLIGTCERDKGAGLTCLNGDGTPRWRWSWPAEVSGAEDRPIRAWTVGRFSGGEALDVFVATDFGAHPTSGATQESWVLDGTTGSVVWHNDGTGIPDYSYRSLGPSNLPSVWDVNGDGKDDVLMMSQALVMVLDGSEGKPLCRPIYPMSHFGEGTPWTAGGSVSLRDLDGDGRPELLLTATYGAWGAMAFDGRPLWSIDPGVGTVCAYHGGVGDVDGDGRLELGMPHAKGFRCYDAATGARTWELAEVRGSTDVVTADVDGDGRDAFILGAGDKLVALRGEKGRGAMLWSLEFEAQIGALVVADVDGDGLAEILVGTADGFLNIVSENRH